MIGGVDVVHNMAGKQCPAYDAQAMQSMPLKLYMYLVLGFIAYSMAQTVKILGYRIIQ